MSMIKKMATAGAVAAMGLGLSAASASAAFDLTGGAYTGNEVGSHVFTAGGYPVTCTTAVFTGNTDNVPTNAASTDFTPDYDNCDLAGFPADVTISGPWRLTVTGVHSAGPPAVYSGDIELLSGSSIKIDVPILGCEVTVTTPQTFNHGRGNSLLGTDNGASFSLAASVQGINYTTNGLCPFGDGSDGSYVGEVAIDGVGVDIV